jgi:hypothetical protein
MNANQVELSQIFDRSSSPNTLRGARDSGDRRG